MIIKSATQIGAPVIRVKAKLVRSATSSQTKKIVRDLIDSMRYQGLVGMAAPQIGIGLRVFVSELRETNVRRVGETDAVRVFINPTIIHRSKKKRVGGEGCGSVAHAGLFGMVQRSANVIVTALNTKGEKFTLTAKGLLAAVIQHEMDHLNGIVFLDRLPDMKSLMGREEYSKKLSKRT
jgi:peptide deformylase